MYCCVVGKKLPFHAVKTLHVNLFIDTILPVSIIYQTVLRGEKCVLSARQLSEAFKMSTVEKL